MSTTLSEQDTFCLASAELSIWQARRLNHAQADHVRYAQVSGQNAATGNAHYYQLSDAKLLLTLELASIRVLVSLAPRLRAEAGLAIATPRHMNRSHDGKLYRRPRDAWG